MTMRLAQVAAAATAMLLAGPVATAHPVHASFAEVGYEAETGALEVSLEVDARDLEVLLKSRTGSPVDLDDRARAEKLVADYVRSAFVVHRGDQAKTARLPVRWVGMELDGAKAILYFAVAVGKGPMELVVRNRVFFELEARQVNTVEVRLGDQRDTLRFTRRRSRHVVKLP